MIELRKRHPALRAERWLTGAPVDASGIPDIEWRHPDGRAMTGADWTRAESRALVAVLYASAAGASAGDRVAVAFNAGGEAVTVHWPDAREGFVWRRSVDTASPAGYSASAEPVDADATLVAARSVQIVVEAPGDAPRRRSSGVEVETLDRLATAAGIAGEWWDMTGGRHLVGADTKRALLRGMGLAAESTEKPACACRPSPTRASVERSRH